MQARCSSNERLKVVVSLLMLSLGLWTSPVAGRMLEKIEFADSLESPKLVLNGLALRTKRRFGMNFKVYAAGLYLPEPSSDAKAIVASRGDKRLELVFLRSVKKSQITESFTEGFKNNCVDHCAEDGLQFAKFDDIMRDLREGDRVRIVTTPKDVVRVEVLGRESTSAEFTGETMRRNVLATFLGEHPATPEFKAGLLGLTPGPELRAPASAEAPR